MIKDKIQVLVEQDRRVFRTGDLALLWEGENRNTLLTTISRYVKSKKLYRIYKGLYAIVPIDKLDKYELGCALFGPLSYVTCETVLQAEGAISQQVQKITLMGKKAGEYEVNGVVYYCRYLRPELLVDRTGIMQYKRYAIASVERAMVDMRRVSPKYYIDNEA